MLDLIEVLIPKITSARGTIDERVLRKPTTDKVYRNGSILLVHSEGVRTVRLVFRSFRTDNMYCSPILSKFGSDFLFSSSVGF